MLAQYVALVISVQDKIREEAEILENPLLRKAERASKMTLRRNSRFNEDLENFLVEIFPKGQKERDEQCWWFGKEAMPRNWRMR